ncbi:MAG: AAA family ATPase [Actinomycetota bacterium]|nr:AAA family ATPase [Actinomycetota bacterium]
MSTFSVALLGPPHLELDGAPIEVDTRKAVALVAYLAVTARTHRRDSLAALLWPDQDQAHARGALRRTISVLRKALGGGWLHAEREEVGLGRNDLWFDLDRFRELLAETGRHGHPAAETCPRCVAALEEAIALHRGDFLEGFSLRDAEDFDDWQFREADALRRDRGGALERLVHALESGGRHEEAISHAQAWLSLDSLHEPAHRALMRQYAETGQRAAAVRQYRECVRILDAELGVQPLAETTELYRAISESRLPSRPAAGGPAAVGHAPGGPSREPGYPLVGRAAELVAMQRAYEAVGPAGRLVVVEGEPGIGKTRLAGEFAAWASRAGALVLTARCYEGEETLAYGPFVQAIRAAAVTAGPGWTGALSPRVLAEAARLAPELAEGTSGATLAGPVPEDPGARSRFLDGVASFLLSALDGPRPGVLVLDDLHWADQASLELLAFLVRRLPGRRVCLVATWRSADVPASHPLRRLAAEAERAGTATVVRPGRLDRAGVDELARAAGVEAAGLTERLFQETEGLPFFLVEYLDALQSGSVEAIEQTPEDVRALIQSRLSTLSQPATQVLAAAAVIGRSFDVETVREASGRSDEETVAALEELTGRGVLREGTDPAGRPRYDFDHERIRAVVQEGTSLARRLLLNRRVADVLAARARREPDLAALAAGHYLQAGRETKAAQHFDMAGRHARSLFANAEALSHFEAALALGHPDAAALHEAIGDLHTLLGEYQAAVASYEAAAALSPEDAMGRLEHKLGNVHQRRGEFEAADRHFEAALAAMDSGSEADRARVMADRSLNAHRRGASKTARSLATRALALAEQARDRPALAQAHNMLGVLASRRGDLPEAREHLEQSLSLAEGLPEPTARIAALNNLAQVRAAAGDVAAAIALTDQALALVRVQGDRHREAALHGNMADLLHAAGRGEGAMEHLKQAAAAFAEIGAEAGEPQPEIWKLVEW